MRASLRSSLQSPQPYAKVPHLWALGVGSVIGAEYFGWQSGLVAGFDGLLIICAVVTVLFVLLAFSIAELSAMLPSGGGSYVFSLHGIGNSAAFFAGLAEAVKIVAACAVGVVAIGSYLNQMLGWSDSMGPLWWIAIFVLFVGLNASGVETTFRIQLVTTILSVALLVVFYVGATTKIDYHQWVVEQDWRFPGGMDGIIRGFSSSVWFYLGIEELPLAVEETIDPTKNMPIGLISAMATLVVITFCTVIFNSAISPGAREMAQSMSPLLDGYKSVFGDNQVTAVFTWLLVVGMVTSFHSFVFYMGRLLEAIARDGFMPRFLTTLHPTRRTPYVALVTGATIGLALVFGLHFTIGDERLGPVLINLACFGALVSYGFQLTAFIRLRIREPDRKRPYRSPFGVTGAVVSLALCAFVLFSIFYNGISSSDFIASVIAGVAIFVLGGVYFFVVVRPTLSDSEPTSTKQYRESATPTKSVV
ncbi:TPA: hypothetical protein N0F65_009098 [Lagenidium giganteum]|uniref:Amino acid transporter n=1 Tax=Lagenidium giganteum TaxID=4803 RepID=A0AAV2YQ87_9STRA|nr:TPA: hypothetical protein N0F65_009098 [Lagenidium giganteum]